MKFEDVLEYFGSGYRLSVDAGFSIQAPVAWKKRGYIPLKSQIKLEKFTNGELKANINHLKPELIV